MTVFQSILLGVIQGLTEFLPISSSGHLVITPYLLGWEFPASEAFVFNVLVQVASLIAVIIFFWHDLSVIVRALVKGLIDRRPFDNPDARVGWYLLLSTIPAGIAGLFLKDLVEKAFGSPLTTGIFLFGTAALLVIAEQVGHRNRNIKQINWLDALIIGLFQVLAIFPGLSRSGSTITGGMIRDLERPSAARFAFLMSIPVMLAAGLLATLDLLKLPDLGSALPVFIPGFIASAIVSYFAIKWLLVFLTRYSLYAFAAYCAAVGVVTLVVSLVIR